MSQPDFDQDCPGATLLWFGQHVGTRLDKLDEGYRRVLLHYHKERPGILNVSGPIDFQYAVVKFNPRSHLLVFQIQRLTRCIPQMVR